MFDPLQFRQGARLLSTSEVTAEDDVDLCASAAAREDGTTVWVTTVNHRLDKPRAVTLDVHGLDAP